ncbi:XAC2610-related protein [Acinetobacter larvae]|uniref:Uncharacterized protein n=1 Tax=Acinetobacter larvae TaxID=1789224 RepID=A0A1B2M044_9GAMM|nr:hypothetical protein [Acinetobacter larvae]AOA58562.1 hypothetical protein BFG52_09490 [Acinetobacter larvae]
MQNNLSYRLTTLAALYILLMSTGYAQSFFIQSASPEYDAQINVLCQKDQCGGPAEIILYKHAQPEIVQRFHTEDLTQYLDEELQPSVNQVELYGEQSSLIFDDFNFDGSTDLAIRNGNNGAYHGPSYDIYVWHKTQHKFIYSKELSELTLTSLGMFEIDKNMKRIRTYNKSGCCYHITQEYHVIPQRGLELVREFIEDATHSNGEKVKVIERKLYQQRWQQTIRYYDLDQYYLE